MSDPLEALIKSAAVTGPATLPNSRYYGLPSLTLTLADGTTVRYFQRRLIPQPEKYAKRRQHVVIDGDRLDNLAAKFLGDPLLFWMLCDANAALDPDDLTRQPGQSIAIPLPAGIPAGGQNG
jgi:hypothetical protein